MSRRPLTAEEKKYLSDFWKSKPKSKEHAENIRKAKLGSKNPMYGKKISEETRLKRSQKLRGKKAWNKGKKCPQLVTNWQGGISTENNRIRHSMEYRQWRETVFERDSYTCQYCNIRGGRLNADHIKPFALYPQLRFDISNGRTLCEDCHKKTPTYARQTKILKELELCQN